MKKITLTIGFLLTSANIFAGSITFNGSFAQTTNPFTTAAPLSKFDPALGTLTSIVFTINGQSTGSVGVTNNSPGSSIYDVTINANLSLLDPLANSLVAVTPIFEDSSFTVAAGATRTDTGTSAVSSNSATILSGFASYIGLTGNPGNVAFSVKGSGSFGANGATPVSVSATTSGVGTESVTYNYTSATTTPEPATITLFGSALVGIVLLARNRPRKL